VLVHNLCLPAIEDLQNKKKKDKAKGNKMGNKLYICCGSDGEPAALGLPRLGGRSFLKIR